MKRLVVALGVVGLLAIPSAAFAVDTDSPANPFSATGYTVNAGATVVIAGSVPSGYTLCLTHLSHLWEGQTPTDSLIVYATGSGTLAKPVYADRIATGSPWSPPNPVCSSNGFRAVRSGPVTVHSYMVIVTTQLVATTSTKAVSATVANTVPVTVGNTVPVSLGTEAVEVSSMGPVTLDEESSPALWLALSILVFAGGFLVGLKLLSAR